MTVIEKMARAMAGLDGGSWEAFVPDAKAALAVMMEPSSHMIAQGSMSWRFDASLYETVSDVFTSMIRAALDEV